MFRQLFLKLFFVSKFGVLRIVSEHQIFCRLVFFHGRDSLSSSMETVVNVVVIGCGNFKENYIACSRYASPGVILTWHKSYGLTRFQNELPA